jgi:hypothetical protein
MKKAHVILLIISICCWDVAAAQSNPMEMGNFFINEVGRGVR